MRSQVGCSKNLSSKAARCPIHADHEIDALPQLHQTPLYTRTPFRGRSQKTAPQDCDGSDTRVADKLLHFQTHSCFVACQGPHAKPVRRVRLLSWTGLKQRTVVLVGPRSKPSRRRESGAAQEPERGWITMKKATTTMTTSKSGSKEGKGGDSPSQLIDARIKELSDWRGETLARVRILIKQADSEVVEEWKWRGVPVWSHAGIICTGETYKTVVKMTFAKGASLEDPSGLFNSSLEGNTRRAIDFHEGDTIDEQALKSLIRAAVALNTSKRAAARPTRSQTGRSQTRPKSARGAS